MTRITHVLCPVDFSDVSRHALAQAAAVARWYEARLTVLYVWANHPTVDVPPFRLDCAQRNRLMNSLREFTGGVSSEVSLVVRVEEAPSVHEAVVAQIQERAADLLVIGTHGRSGFQHLFLGSVTEKVIRKASCPVLVVPPRAPSVDQNAPVQFRHLVCPIDFSDCSLHALDMAVALAQETDARLTLLHVVEMPLGLDHEASTAALESIRTAAAASATHRLQQLVPEQAQTYCNIDVSVVQGRSYTEILRQASDGAADLIVMGVHGRSGADVAMFGSTTHHVLRRAVCPVLIVNRK